MVAKDGYCRPFDENASGYSRAEAVCCIFLQKHKDAKRIYCTMVHTKVNCDGHKEEGILFPSSAMQGRLMEEFYKEINLDTSLIHYVEAHGTGTPAGDPIECASIDNVISKNRKTPLLIGSVKSNMGHSEPASGLCSIAKIICAYQTNLIPPNLHYTSPRQAIEPIKNGRMKVVAPDAVPLTSPYVACNSYGFGGANAHVLLKGFTQIKKLNYELDNLPRLILWSGRTEESCSVIFDEIIQRPLDVEFIGLLHNIQSVPTPGYVYRGFGLFTLNENNSECLSKEIQHYNGGGKHPVVWVFSGMGSQWAGMGKSLLEIPIFQKAINECHQILKPFGLDLIQIITSSDPSIFNNILHSFVGIAAIQIGLVNILRALEIVPDIIIGHSVGELGCAYADNCLTANEMILSAYYRGVVSIEAQTIFGSMAAIGMNYQEIQPLLPEDIEVACHNSPDSCTISGPSNRVSEFVNQLKEQGIFAKEVPCSNIPFHSRYIRDLGPKLLMHLQNLIKVPKQRSKKWLSTSVPQKKWNDLQHQFCSAEYLTNNLLNPVLFEEVMKLLSLNVITIEIAPHGLLQSILRKGLPESQNIALTKRGTSDINFFLSALGK